MQKLTVGRREQDGITVTIASVRKLFRSDAGNLGNSAEIMIYNMKDHERIFNMVKPVLYSTNVVHLFTLCNKMQYSSSISSH